MSTKPRPTLAQLENQVQTAWVDLRHNAYTMHVHWPDNDLSYDEFDDWFNSENQAALSVMSVACKTDLHQSYTFTQYGRGGATVAPVELCALLFYNEYDKFADITYQITYDLTGLEAYNALHQALRLLDWTNAYIKSYVESLPARLTIYLASL